MVSNNLSTTTPLTLQQRAVVRLIASGMPNKQIAYELGCTEATVKAHVSEALAKTGCRSRTQMALSYLASLPSEERDQLLRERFPNADHAWRGVPYPRGGGTGFVVPDGNTT